MANAFPPVTSAVVELTVGNICRGPYLEAAYEYANDGSASVGAVIRTNTPNVSIPPATFNR
jgi:hypothetical protein